MSLKLTATLKIDAAWFRAHPNAECLLRSMVPGEFPRFLLEGERHVLVTPAGRGVMHKLPVKLYAEHDGMPSELKWVDTGETWHVRRSGEVVPKGPTSREAWEAFLDPETQSLVRMGREMLGGAK